MECTGAAKTRDFADRGLRAGARKVLISGPSDAAEKTIVLGANEAELGDERIISNASCTTNAIAPLLKEIETQFGIEHGHVTTIHCYTGSQPTLDAPGSSFERSRAAAVSMVPTSTSAAQQIERVLPKFTGRISVSAVRVPCISVSAIDAVLQLKEIPNGSMSETLAEMFRANPVIDTVSDPCVSSDLRGNAASLIVSLGDTLSVTPSQLRILGWYDNEWGFLHA